MQQERLIIKNLFTLKDIDIELGKYNVFIGEQASGKSLILKILYFFRSILFVPISGYNIDSKKLHEMFIHLFCSYLNISSYDQNLYIEYRRGDYEIKFFVKIDKFDLEYSNNLTKLYTKTRQSLVMRNEELQKNDTFDDVFKNSIMDLEIQRLIDHSHLGKFSLAKLLPAGRMSFYTILSNLFNIVGNDQQNLNQLIIIFGQDYQKAFSRYNNVLDSTKHRLSIFDELSEKILKGKYVYDQFGGYLKQNDFQTKLSDGSSGQQEFIPIHIILRDYLLSGFEQGKLYIEEPEAHLYPSAQKAITELLVYVTNATNSDGLYITTHSPYILTVLNNLILANDVKDKQALFDKDLLVPFEDVRAYYIADGAARDLRDMENRLIVAENLDKVSEQTAIDFDKLLDMKYE